ncbi:MAG: hypothetical protein LBU24_01830 [Methanocalculaceae archaeon]|jgi:3'-5' exoribonuclease|nr:hypothetical protein [Methanocalculaceae archaeon]
MSCRHHEYIGGLCEYSLETVRIVLNFVETMPRIEINRDMVIAGSVLHDIGNIFCFDKVGYSYVTNDTDNLIEHIAMGIMFIDAYKKILSPYRNSCSIATLFSHITASMGISCL